MIGSFDVTKSGANTVGDIRKKIVAPDPSFKGYIYSNRCPKADDITYASIETTRLHTVHNNILYIIKLA